MPDKFWRTRDEKQTALRVLILQGGSLFDEGLNSLLRRDGNLQILTVELGDAVAFFQEVARLSPEVILLNGADDLKTIKFCDLLNAIPTATHLRLVIVRPDDNVIDVYERRRVVAAQSSDLLAIIRGNHKRA